MDTRHEELIQAIAKNDAFRVRALLNENPELVSTRDSEGRTPILLCLYFGNEELAHLVREEAPDPDLFEAAALGDLGLVQEKLAATPQGANAVSPDGFGVLGLAVYFGRPDVAKHLLSAGADADTPSANDFRVRPIHSAAAHRDAAVSLELGRILLDSGANPNVAQAGGWSPLHQAAAHGRLEMAELLIKAGADRTARSEDGRTAAEMAGAKGHAELEAFLQGESA